MQPHIPDVPLFRSADLHIEATSKILAGVADIDSYLPPCERRKGCLSPSIEILKEQNQVTKSEESTTTLTINKLEWTVHRLINKDNGSQQVIIEEIPRLKQFCHATIQKTGCIYI
eukprot:Awhi_evm1s4812